MQQDRSDWPDALNLVYTCGTDLDWRNTTEEILRAHGARLRHVHLHDDKGGDASAMPPYCNPVTRLSE